MRSVIILALQHGVDYPARQHTGPSVSRRSVECSPSLGNGLPVLVLTLKERYRQRANSFWRAMRAIGQWASPLSYSLASYSVLSRGEGARPT